MKWIVLKEIKEFLLKNKKVFWLSVFAFAFSCVAINLTLTYYLDAESIRKEMEESYGDKSFYKIMVQGDEEALANFFTAEHVMKIKKFFEEICSSPDFEYRYAQKNSIEFFDVENPAYSPKDFPAYKETCLYGYETGEPSVREDYVSLKGIFADHLFGTESTLELSEGSWFQNTDFYIDSQENMELPVILGHEYAGLYKLGDRIQHAHIGTVENTTLTVVGFLKENSYFYDNNNDKIVLNRYLVVPSVEVTDRFPYRNRDGSYNDCFLNAYDSLKIMNARIICSRTSAKRVEKEIKEICQNTGMYEIRVQDETSGAVEDLKDMESRASSCLSISLFIIILSTIVYGIQLNYKLVKDRKKYSIFVLNGMTRKQLFLITIVDSLFVFVVADVLFLAFWFFNFRRGTQGLGLSGYTFVLIPVLELCILIVMGLYGTWQTNRINMSMALRENE